MGGVHGRMTGVAGGVGAEADTVNELDSRHPVGMHSCSVFTWCST